MVERLTARQHEFLNQFVGLYAPLREPLHYTTVARHVGVGNVSAYEMLRVLERRGLVVAEYHLPRGDRGPGRPLVMFRPTLLGSRLATQRPDSGPEPDEWWRARTRILGELERGKAEDFGALVDELISSTPGSRSSMVYAAEMATAVVVGLGSLRRGTHAGALRDAIRELSRNAEGGLRMLAGLGLGISLAGDLNRRLAGFLMAQSGSFQEALSGLSEENLHRLSDFVQHVLQIVGM